MESVRRLGPDWFWVGGSDRRLARFENMFPLPDGVAYNTYLLLDEKTVLIDTVERGGDPAVPGEYRGRAERPAPCFLVVNHMEPSLQPTSSPGGPIPRYEKSWETAKPSS